MKEKCTNLLKELTGKKNIFFTDRGNTSILLSMKLASYLGKAKLLIQDQGGWLTYKDYAKRAKLTIVELKTDYGLVDLDELREKADSETIFLLNTMPGYFAEINDMDGIVKACREKNTFLVNDASATIGSELAKPGDIVIGSFGHAKPVEVNYGGFIATNETEHIRFFEENMAKEVRDFYPELYPKLLMLPERRKQLSETHWKIKKDLAGFDIIHKEISGINVIAKFNNEETKQKLIEYCSKNSYEYTLCPRYIRVLCDAVSIEVKRQG